MSHRSRDLRTLIAIGGYLGLIAIFCVATTTSASGQQQKKYKMIPKERTILPGAKKLRQLKSDVKQALSSGSAPSDGQKRTLQQYYIYHVMAGMTRPEGAADPQLMPEWRKQVVSDLSRLGDNPGMHNYVNGLIFNTASRLAANPDYSPATRYNSLLLVGELNDREMRVSGRNVTPAVPHSNARKVLLKLANDPNEEEAIRIGAMIGLARHARLMAAANAKPDSNIVKTFAGVLKTEPSADGNNDGLWWMQRIAVDAFGNMGKSAATPALESVLADESRPTYLRCAAAEALGKLDYRNAKVDVNAIAKGLGELALVSLTEQIKSIQAYLKENPADERPKRNRFDQENAEPEENPFVSQVRRQLKYELQCVSGGVDGVKGAPGDTTAQNNLTSLKSEIEKIERQLNSKSMQPDDLVNRITSPALRLQNIVKNIQ